MIEISSSVFCYDDCDTLIFFISKSAKQALMDDALPDFVLSRLDLLQKNGDFTGEKNAVLTLYLSAAEQEKIARLADIDSEKVPLRLLFVGLGEDDKEPECWRQAAGSAVRHLLKTKAINARVFMSPAWQQPPFAVTSALCEGFLLGSYRFVRYGKERDARKDLPKAVPVSAEKGNGWASDLAKQHADAGEDSLPVLERVIISGPPELAATVASSVCVAKAVWRARDMANEPPDRWTPEHFADYADKLAVKYGFKLQVFDKQKLGEAGMGGILAVSRGSALPPQLVILEHKAGEAAPTLLLVGKGLTFDSGGISLKPSQGMEEMKYDMCGGAAVLAVMEALGDDKPAGLNVVAMVPSAENLPGPEAVKPGEVIRQYGGKSVEVVNTDAEGRLLLADALAYGIERYQPDAVIDIATLTGAAIVALGHHHAALFANNEELCDRLLAAAQATDEPLWRMPLGKVYAKQLKSKVAELKNSDKREGSAILAAVFLEAFVGETAWAHIDIAGTAWNYTEKSYTDKGPTGFGVRSIVHLIRNWSGRGRI